MSAEPQHRSGVGRHARPRRAKIRHGPGDQIGDCAVGSLADHDGPVAPAEQRRRNRHDDVAEHRQDIDQQQRHRPHVADHQGDLLRSEAVDHHQRRHRDQHRGDAVVAVERSSRGRNRRDQRGNAQRDPDIDPEDKAAVAPGQVGLLDRGLRQAEIVEDRQKAEHRCAHGDDAEIARAQQARQNDLGTEQDDCLGNLDHDAENGPARRPHHHVGGINHVCRTNPQYKPVGSAVVVEQALS